MTTTMMLILRFWHLFVMPVQVMLWLHYDASTGMAFSLQQQAGPAGDPYHHHHHHHQRRPTTFKNSAISTTTTTTTTTTTLYQAHQEIRDYREGIGSAHYPREGRHPDDKIQVVMKFGGSSLADFSRVDHVAKLIQGQIEEAGYFPRAVVCSAMGKTTNALLSAGDFALGTCT